MSKIFRLHAGASESIVHWHNVGSHLHDTYIASINDPSGENAQTQITSIPSPFARMDLVRTAFKNVCLKKDLDGITIYHRMISDCFDVGEIFFNIEAFSDKVEILEWNSGIIVNGGQLDVEPNSELGRLINSVNPKHRLLGETLKMYLFQDQKSFNFSDLKNCYLLNYKHGPEIINIIGGTSSATLFFSSANDLSFVDISFANDKVFDNKFCPLHKRGREFIKFIYSFRAAFTNFSEKFPDIDKYLDLTFKLLDDTLKDAIRGLNADNYDNDYNKISVNAAGNNAEILGFKLRTKNYGVLPSSEDNDFIIETSKISEGLVPCVLPNEPFNEALRYAGGKWQSSYYENVPFYDERPLKDRTLPNQSHIKYPYLTVSDLLEPYLIRLPFPLDNTKFFDGNYEIRVGEKDHSFILPVRKDFFRYFNTEDIQGIASDGKKKFELLQMTGGVKAILRIPIKSGRYIELSRIYTFNQFQDRIQQPDEKTNLGIIVDNQFTLAVYPFLRLSQDINPHYRIMMVDRDVHQLTKQHNYTLNFYNQVPPLIALTVQPPKIRSNKRQVQGVTTAYHIVEQNFDFIEINNNSSVGLVIPLFKTQPIASRVFKFAIDFGTTNTHIEYKVANEESRPFDITEKDIQLGTLHSADEDAVVTSLRSQSLKYGIGTVKLIEIIKEEFLPATIAPNTQYKFPQRTIINDNGSFNPDESTFALADFNIPFWYLKEDLRVSSEITPNLKWLDFRSNRRFEKRTEGFLEQLFLMVRNKVLLNGGDIASTEIVWFYPSSMPKFMRSRLEQTWNKYFKQYIPTATKLNKMSESFAPFYYYYHKENVKPHDRPAVNIDIGGGTTDIVIYHSEKPILLTSFRFAANAIFGDGYGSTSVSNGFVQRYESTVRESLANTVASPLFGIYDNLRQKNSSSIELVEFFFSLEDNKVIKENKIPLSFSKLLSEDNELKLVFIFFYSAIIYHIAKLMRSKRIEIPDYITFSGNGSKVIKLTDSSTDLSTLLAYTKVIFEDVYEIQKSPAIEFRFFKNPKEITCKGGLECNNFAQFELLEKEIKTVLVGASEPTMIPPSTLMYTQIQEEGIINSVCTEVSLFINKFFEWDSKFNYYQNFGVSSKNFKEYQQLLSSKIKVDLISGIKEKLSESYENINIDIEETLFFYPLVGSINRLAHSLQKNTK